MCHTIHQCSSIWQPILQGCLCVYQEESFPEEKTWPLSRFFLYQHVHKNLKNSTGTNILSTVLGSRPIRNVNYAIKIDGIDRLLINYSTQQQRCKQKTIRIMDELDISIDVFNAEVLIVNYYCYYYYYYYLAKRFYKMTNKY